MHRILIVCTIIAYGLCLNPLRAQEREEMASPRVYLGTHLGLPLFWGDLFSINEKLQPGFGAGVFSGIQFNRYWSVELGLDYAKGRLAARSWQQNDLLDESGTIRYINGRYPLGSLYSETQFLRIGIRLPFQLVNLLSVQERRFNIEVAPHYYLNRFKADIVERNTDETLPIATTPRPWSHSFGGDFAINYGHVSGTQVFLRSSLSWLSDDRFEGIRTDPAWRVNLNLFTTVGIRFALGKREKKHTEIEKPKAVTQDIAPNIKIEMQPDSTSHPVSEHDNTVVSTEIAEKEPQIDSSTNTAAVSLPPIYFQLNSAYLNLTNNRASLAAILKEIQQDNSRFIHIVGWTDKSGPRTFNQSLSQKRAKAVADFLIQQGVEANRIQQEGKGVDTNETAPTKARRVDIHLAIYP